MKKFMLVVSMALSVALVSIALLGCDTSCDEEGATECSGASLKTCIDGEWEFTDCYEDECDPNGYASGTCTVSGDNAYCECGA